MSALRSFLECSAVSALLLPCASVRHDEVARWAPACGEQVEWHWSGRQSHRLVPPKWEHEHGSEYREVRHLEECHAAQDSFELRVADRIVARDERAPVQLERFVLHARRTVCAEWGRPGMTLRFEELATLSLFERALLVYGHDAEQDELLVQLAVSPRVPQEFLDESVLAGLDPALDLRALLGGAPRRPGDAWPLGEEALLPLVRPGGQLVFEPLERDFAAGLEDAADGWPRPLPMTGPIGDAPITYMVGEAPVALVVGAASVSAHGEAKGRAAYVRTEQRDGVRIARIELSGTIETGGSALPELEHLGIPHRAAGEYFRPSEAPTIERWIRFRGELLWDLDAVRAHALEVEGESRSKVILPNGIWGGGEELFEEWHGELQLRVTARTVE